MESKENKYNMTSSNNSYKDYLKIDKSDIELFEELMNSELNKGKEKYGNLDDTLEFIRGVDKDFELGAIAKYISRIAHGDSRSETDIVKVATYAYFYWKRHYASPK